MKSRGTARLAAAVAILLAGFIFISLWSPGEGVKLDKRLSTLPIDLDSWEGRVLTVDSKVLVVAGVDDYLMRVYARRPDASADAAPGPPSPPVNLYIGYYESQRKGRTYHSPKNCMPGSGWEFVDTGRVNITLGNETREVNRVIIQKGLDRQLVLYWYQDRGRIIASEYSAKAYLIYDSVTRRRTDGALVRVITPLYGDEEAAFRYARTFTEEVFPHIARLLPG